MVLGKPGTGKSTSVRTLTPSETIIIKPNAKPLPFRGSARQYVQGVNSFFTKSLADIPGWILWADSNPAVKNIIIEDYSHFFTAHTLDSAFRSNSAGGNAFKRWADFGALVYESIVGIDITQMREDLNIIVMHHTEIKDDGVIGSKSSGKLLDNEVVLDSHVTYLLHTRMVPGDKPADRYKFQVQFDGVFMSKTPDGVFDTEMVPNDLQFVLDKIMEYELGEAPVSIPVAPTAEPVVADEAAAAVEPEVVAVVAAVTSAVAQ